MLQVGLTGGIGSGKSTVALRLVDHGALLVDSDALAREVVAGGSPGLAEIVEAFGGDVVGPDGELDRRRLASMVFGDPAARSRLDAIVHPRVRRRSAELVAAAPPDAVVVQDVPLLVEGGMASSFPLVVVVHADARERVRRLVGSRGMTEADAWPRIAAQADDDARRAAADVWLDNGGTAVELAAAVDQLWTERLVPFERNLRGRVAATGWPSRLVPPDPEWPAQATRLADRIALAAGERGRGVDHVGATAVPGLPAEDVVDVQLAVDRLADADADPLRDALADAGFPAIAGTDRDDLGAVEPAAAQRLGHGSADPGRPARLHVREVGSAGWRSALLFRDWLRADGVARADYLGVRNAGATTSVPTWFDAAAVRAEDWATASGWRPTVGCGGVPRR